LNAGVAEPLFIQGSSTSLREIFMTQAVEQLKSAAGSLTSSERADLAYFLLSSLDPVEQGAEAAWHDEIARRVAEIQSGQAIGRSAQEVFAELRERYP